MKKLLGIVVLGLLWKLSFLLIVWEPRQAKNSVFFKVIGTKNISIAAGMFNRPIKLKTIMNVFVKDKYDYYKLDNQIPKFKRYPKEAKKFYYKWKNF